MKKIFSALFLVCSFASAQQQPVYNTTLPTYSINGQYTQLQSASNGSLITTDNDGNARANNVFGDAGQNARIVTGSRKEVSYSTTTAQAVALTDVSNYACVSIHALTSGTGSTATFQSSNDPAQTTWQNLPLVADSTAPGYASSVVASVSGNHIFTGALTGRYFRINVTGISAGTTAGTVEFFSTCRPTFAQISSATQLTGLAPSGSVQITADSGNVAATTATATLAAASG